MQESSTLIGDNKEQLKKDKRRKASRLHYLKKVKGNIKNFSKNCDYDEALFKFLKYKYEFINNEAVFEPTTEKD